MPSAMPIRQSHIPADDQMLGDHPGRRPLPAVEPAGHRQGAQPGPDRRRPRRRSPPAPTARSRRSGSRSRDAGRSPPAPGSARRRPAGASPGVLLRPAPPPSRRRPRRARSPPAAPADRHPSWLAAATTGQSGHQITICLWSPARASRSDCRGRRHSSRNGKALFRSSLLPILGARLATLAERRSARALDARDCVISRPGRRRAGRAGGRVGRRSGRGRAATAGRGGSGRLR